MVVTVIAEKHPLTLAVLSLTVVKADSRYIYGMGIWLLVE
jgi:hypothetical protein